MAKRRRRMLAATAIAAGASLIPPKAQAHIRVPNRYQRQLDAEARKRLMQPKARIPRTLVLTKKRVKELKKVAKEWGSYVDRHREGGRINVGLPVSKRGLRNISNIGLLTAFKEGLEYRLREVYKTEHYLNTAKFDIETSSPKKFKEYKTLEQVLLLEHAYRLDEFLKFRAIVPEMKKYIKIVDDRIEEIKKEKEGRKREKPPKKIDAPKSRKGLKWIPKIRFRRKTPEKGRRN